MMGYLEEMDAKEIETVVAREMAGLMNVTTDQRLREAAMLVHCHFLTDVGEAQSYGQHCKEYTG